MNFARSTSPTWESITARTSTLHATQRNANIPLRCRWSAPAIPSPNAASSDESGQVLLRRRETLLFLSDGSLAAAPREDYAGQHDGAA
jgi:hypothetical protein